MSARPVPSSSFASQKALVMRGMQASITARTKAGLDLLSPTCIYGLCEAHNVNVRFNDINMEGMYDRQPKPRIHVSALRPLARRTFTCAHELGHHVFGHGSTIDELREALKLTANRGSIENAPAEILSDVETQVRKIYQEIVESGAWLELSWLEDEAEGYNTIEKERRNFDVRVAKANKANIARLPDDPDAVLIEPRRESEVHSMVVLLFAKDRSCSRLRLSITTRMMELMSLLRVETNRLY